MARAETVDVAKAQCKANAFNFFHSASKACLLPFLSIYLRYLGLSAFQTGIIIASQAWTYMLFGPFWTRCAFGCQKKKFVLAFSLLALITSFLLMTIIPRIQNSVDLSCTKSTNGTLNVVSNITELNTAVGSNRTPMNTTPGPTGSKLQDEILPDLKAVFQSLTPEQRETLKSHGITAETLPNITEEQLKKYMEMMKGESSHEETTKLPTIVTTARTAFGREQENKKNREAIQKLFDNLTLEERENLKMAGITLEKLQSVPIEELSKLLKKVQEQVSNGNDNPVPPVRDSTNQKHSGSKSNDAAVEFYNKQPSYLKRYIEKYYHKTAESFRGWSVQQTENYISNIKQNDKDENVGPHQRDVEQKSDKDPQNMVDNSTDGNRTFDASETVSENDIFVKAMDTVTNNLRAFSVRLGHLKEEVFLAVLLLVIFGGIFSAPTERVADSMWFEFLDGMDRLEVFGGHRVAAAIGVLIFPIVVTVAVDNTPCFLPFHMHHILLHFYSFTLLGAIAFVLAFFFPVYAGHKKILRTSRLCKGLGVLCSDKHAALFAISAIVAGMMQGLLTTFLFWQVQDHGGSEIYMGGAVAIAAGGDLFVQLIQKAMIRRLTNAGTVLLGLFILGLRLVVYSFMWRPYVVLAGEAFHALSHTLILVSVETYKDFRLNPLAMDRSAFAALTFVYQGFGVGVGAITSGALYGLVGVATVFQGACVATVIWSILFAVLQRCLRKPAKVRYTKLLQEEDIDLSDESEVAYEDDWLEVAMKHQK